MADNQSNKTHDQLLNEKLQAEIDILHAKLEKEYPQQRRERLYDKLAEFARKWSAFVLGTVTLISAIFGVFLPLTEYLDESRKALSYQLNDNMIGFVDSLNSKNPAEFNRSVMMLSYYEMNSVPILLFFLEATNPNQDEFRTKIMETIDLIYIDDGSNRIVKMVLSRMQNNIDRLKKVDESSSEAEWDDNQQNGFYNYSELINNLKLAGRDEKLVKKEYQVMLNKINKDEWLVNNPNIKGVIRRLDKYPNNNESTNNYNR